MLHMYKIKRPLLLPTELTATTFTMGSEFSKGSYKEERKYSLLHRQGRLKPHKADSYFISWVPHLEKRILLINSGNCCLTINYATMGTVTTIQSEKKKTIKVETIALKPCTWGKHTHIPRGSVPVKSKGRE